MIVMGDLLQGIPVQGISFSVFALAVVGFIIRGYLVPKLSVDRGDAIRQQSVDNALAEAKHWRDAAEQWRGAFDSSQKALAEVVEQNSKLLLQSEMSLRMIEAVRLEAEKRSTS